MKFTVVINCEPGCETAFHALGFCSALLDSGHELLGVMLVERGAKLVNSDYADKWHALASKRPFPIHCCVNAAHAHGIVNDETATLKAPFELSGLGQLAALSASCDRIITFGQRIKESLKC